MVRHIAAKAASLLIISTALGSCSREFGTVPAAPAAEDISATEEDGFVPGRMNVRVSGELAAELEAASDGNGVVVLGSVKTVSGAGFTSMRRLFPPAGRFEQRTRREGLHLWYAVTFDEDRSSTKACRSALGNIEGIEYAEAVPRIRPAGGTITYAAMSSGNGNGNGASLPFDDPLLADQWHYCNNGDEPCAIAGCDINVFPVWERITTGSPEIIVSVVDGGIDYAHEDLAGNMWHNPEMTGHEVYGYNFVENSYNIHPHDHGTHVAGTIAAVNNNGKGVCGIAGGNAAKGLPGVKLMSCQIFDDTVEGSADCEAAIKWGADHGAVISQNSWEYGFAEMPQALKDAINYFIKYAGMDEYGRQTGPMAGGIVFLAAGNNNSDVSLNSQGNAVTVGAMGPDFQRSSYSNFGDWVDIAAPGGEKHKGSSILSTLPGNRYGYMDGTSMACPHASGVAALVLAVRQGQGYTSGDLEEAILGTVSDISMFGQDHPAGKGLLDAYEASGGNAGSSETPARPGDFGTDAASNTATVSFVIPDVPADEIPYYVKVYYSENEIVTGEGVPYARFRVAGVGPGSVFTGLIHGLEFGRTYHLAAASCSLDGAESDLSDRAEITTGINHAPVVKARGPLTATLRSFEKYRFEFDVTDSDGHFCNYSISDRIYGISADSTNISNPAAFVDASCMAGGHYETYFVCTDAYGAADSIAFAVDILPNHNPKIKRKCEGIVLNGVAAEFDASDYFTDEDEEPLNYSFSTENTDLVDVIQDGGKFKLIPRKVGYGKITIKATDAHKSSISQIFDFLVRDHSGSLDVYPNPVTDILFLRTDTLVNASVTVINQAGAEVRAADIEVGPFNPVQVDMKNLPGGIYAVEISYDSRILSKNVVKL